jgi:LAO/AO transport system kinase
MNELSLHPNAFVRPSPSSSHLGGVNRSTRESILLCEAAGYNIVLVETVGVGQSETAVHAMTDFFLLLMLAGAGDQLQGIKRGIMELTDAMVITKADGGNELKADRAKGEYTSALHLFPQRENNWMPQVFTTSSLEAKGIDVVWKEIDKFNRWSISNGWKEENRKRQLISSFEEQIQNVLLHQLQNKPNFKEKYESTLNRVVSKELSAHRAAESFIALFFSA